MGYKNRDDQRAYQLLWMKKRREEFFAGKCCARCGEKEGLELDHIDPRKKVDHRIWSWKKERREKELEKCQPLCGKCHILKTIEYGENRNRNYKGLIHGTRNGYDTYFCRCEACRAAHSEALKKWKLSRKFHVKPSPS